MGRKQLTEIDRAFGRGLGRALKTERERSNLSGEALARIADVSVDEVRSLESGRVANPGILTLHRLSRALDCSLDHLVEDAQNIDSQARRS